MVHQLRKSKLINPARRCAEPRKNRERVNKSVASGPRRRSARLNTVAKDFVSQGQCVGEKRRTVTAEPRGTKRPRIGIESPVCAPTDSTPPKRQKHTVFCTADQNEAYLSGIDCWRREGYWPTNFQESLHQGTMSHLCKRRCSVQSLRRKRSEPESLATSSNTPSDQRPRDEKSSQYQNPRYTILLETRGSFMDESPLDITDESKSLCRSLLEGQQSVPDNTLFRDDIFSQTCRRIDDKNEARVVQDITRLIVPSAETLATFGAKELDILIESVNEGWNSCVPLTSSRPQPDYAVGLSQKAFSTEQREKLSPHLGNVVAGDQSVFMATYYMLFPFLTCEVKCGAAALDVADRQNAHSMTLAVKAVVELFRLTGRADELNREILAFSISHDHRSVRIYGHYAVIEGTKTTFFRHLIHEFSLRALDGKEKWTAYKFTKNVYEKWVPIHFQRLCSIIDGLPRGVDFDVPTLSQASALSQGSVSSSQLDTGLPSPDASFMQGQPSKRQNGRKGS